MSENASPEPGTTTATDTTTTATTGTVESVLEPANGQNDGLMPFLNPEALPWVVFVLIVTALLTRAVAATAKRLGEQVARRRLAVNQVSTLLRFGFWAIAALVAVNSLFDLSSQAVFALSGTLAVAAGFLLKDVAESFVAGIAILVAKPFQVGDRITFGGHYGEVVEIGLRTVKLVTLDDNLVTVPTSLFSSQPVASANAGALECMVVIPFYLSTEVDHKQASDIVHEAVLSSRYLYLGKPINVLVRMLLTEGVGPLIEVTAKAYVCDTRYEKAFASDVTDQALTAFREIGGMLTPPALPSGRGQALAPSPSAVLN